MRVMTNSRDERGRFSATVTDEEIKTALRDHGPLGTQEVADRLDIGYDAAYKRLKQLRSNGEVESRRVGNAHLWVSQS
jgi:predicted ArsR family transcriptional regulator